MTIFSRVRIYKISSPYFPKVYIGSTTMNLEDRLRCHRKNKDCSSVALFEYRDVKIEELECLLDCSIEYRKERERHYIQQFDVVNKMKLK